MVYGYCCQAYSGRMQTGYTGFRPLRSYRKGPLEWKGASPQVIEDGPDGRGLGCFAFDLLLDSQTFGC